MSEKDIIKIVLNELQERNLIKNAESSYKNTELLLYNYNNIKESIGKYREQIKDLIENGIPNSSPAVRMIGNSGFKDNSTILEEQVNNLNHTIIRTKNTIRFINSVLSKIQTDKYYEIITLKYFQNKTLEEIAEYFECETSTITRNKKRLLNEIKVLLFPNAFIDELGH